MRARNLWESLQPSDFAGIFGIGVFALAGMPATTFLAFVVIVMVWSSREPTL